MPGYQFIGKATPTMQKQINTSLVYHYIYEHDLCHRAIIAKDLNLSAPAVSRAVETLLERQDILEKSKVQLKNGKKVSQLQFNAEKGYVIGIDLLRSPLKLVIADYTGKIVKRHTGFDMNREDDITKDLIVETRKLIDSFVADGIPKKKITAVGVGVPATIDSTTGVVLGTQRYDYLLGQNYGETIEAAFKLPTFVDNVTNMSALAERRRGVSKGKKDSVFVEISTGIGLGLIMNGTIYPGSFGAAGEIGYTPLSLEHLKEPSGPLGYLERTFSMQGLASRAQLCGIGLGCDSPLTVVAETFSLAHEGNADALNICNDFLQHLLILCSNVILILNPDQVVVGGSIAEMPHIDELVLAPLAQQLRAILPFDLPQIVLSSLGDDSGVIGAVEMALNRLKSAQYPYRTER
jgi:predicted NBD/HSP70 family sugar kinase